MSERRIGRRRPDMSTVVAFGRDDDPRRIDVDDVAFDDVVAERVVNGGADDLGAAGHLGVARRVELDLIQPARRIRHAVARA